MAGVQFVPLRDQTGEVVPVLAGADLCLKKILSGYVDRRGKSCDNCVVAIIPDQGWDLDKEALAQVHLAARYLFLAGWACNEYDTEFGGEYVSSTNYRVIGQGFRGSEPTHLAVFIRRRDGSITDMGYRHGELKFSLPFQVGLGGFASVDEALLCALDRAHAEQSPVAARLQTALPFVTLANTDDDWMTEPAEAILMGSAFEQLLHGKNGGSAYGLGRRFGALFQSYGSVTAEAARVNRPGIALDLTTAESSDAQPGWWVHRKWMEELYDARSKAVHKGGHDSREWGWSAGEHLVMAAYAFPLAVKLMLRAEGHYELEDKDELGCRAIDRILATKEWWVDDANGNTDISEPSWHSVTLEVRREDRLQKIWEAAAQKHPEWAQEPTPQAQTKGDPANTLMPLFLLRTFQQQVLLQFEFVLMARDQLERGLGDEDGTDAVFFALQNLLNAAGNASKALWGSGGKRADQRVDLRDSIGVTDDSPLRVMTMRNNFEHFDERLTHWWKESPRRIIIDRNLGPDGITGAANVEMLRNYDPTTMTLTFWGQRFSVGDLIREVERVIPVLRVEASKPHW